jgi:hypothetical protein
VEEIMSATAVAVRKPSSGPYRKTAVLVGVLFLAATATFAIGGGLITSYFSGEGGETSTLATGVLFEALSAIAVAAIGVAMWPIFRRYSEGLGRGYMVLRIGEALMIISAGVYMLATKNDFNHYDAFIYVFTASAGLIFSYLLYVSGLIPRFLAVLGLIGYISLAVGIPVSLLGDVKLDAGWGLIFVAAGAVFELVVPLLLIFKGFSFPKGELREDSGTSLVPEKPVGVSV